ncbi:hypothetical protein GJ496_004806 [Pomphorhynchus laevis]|nr:hypothetical protein GJ496_004806 [Pomphorhynchus laevis]
MMRTAQSNLPWVEKYRPKSLDELISHQDIIKTIVKFMDAKQLPHLLLYGPPGTGKTSTITACAHQFYNEPGQYRSMVLEMNASDDRGINVVREKIVNFASTGLFYQPTSSEGNPQYNVHHKLVILDEADAMTNDAQNALRRVIEQFTSNVRFCFICNYLSPIIPAIQSRCTRFRFAPLSKDQMLIRLHEIVKQENVKIEDDEALDAIYTLSAGDMRKALSILQSVHYSRDSLTLKSVYECSSKPSPAEIRHIIISLLNDSIKQSVQKVEAICKSNGYALMDLLTESSKLVMRLNMPVNMKVSVIKKLADSEYRLAAGAVEILEIGAFVAAFQIVRDIDPNDICD